MEWKKYQANKAKQLDDGKEIKQELLIVECRQLMGSETVKCPKHNKNWIGVIGDWVVRLPSGKIMDSFKKNAGGESVHTVSHGAVFILKHPVFVKSYVAIEGEGS